LPRGPRPPPPPPSPTHPPAHTPGSSSDSRVSGAGEAGEGGDCDSCGAQPCEITPCCICTGRSDGATALHTAAHHGFLHIVSYLLSLPTCRVNVRAVILGTPYDVAMQRRNRECAAAIAAEVRRRLQSGSCGLLWCQPERMDHGCRPHLTPPPAPPLPAHHHLAAPARTSILSFACVACPVPAARHAHSLEPVPASVAAHLWGHQPTSTCGQGGCGGPGTPV
jgi:hypothetical protein